MSKDSKTPPGKAVPPKGGAVAGKDQSPYRRNVTRKKFALERDGYQIDKTTYKQTF